MSQTTHGKYTNTMTHNRYFVRGQTLSGEGAIPHNTNYHTLCVYTMKNTRQNKQEGTKTTQYRTSKTNNVIVRKTHTTDPSLAKI